MHNLPEGFSFPRLLFFGPSIVPEELHCYGTGFIPASLWKVGGRDNTIRTAWPNKEHWEMGARKERRGGQFCGEHILLKIGMVCMCA